MEKPRNEVIGNRETMCMVMRLVIKIRRQKEIEKTRKYIKR